jgi:hypothetical protein
MVQGLFFDGVDAEPAGPTVGGQDHLGILAGADEAHTPLPLMKLAKARAQIALDAAVFYGVPVTAGDGVDELAR